MRTPFAFVLAGSLLAAPLAAQPQPQGRSDPASAGSRAANPACGGSIAIDETGVHRTPGPRRPVAGIAIDETGVHLHNMADRARLAAVMNDVARRSGVTISAGHVELVSTAEGTLAIAPTAAAMSGRTAPGDAVMLVWATLPGAGGRPVTGFFQVTTASGTARAAPGTACAPLPASLQRALYWRLRGGGTGDANARFEYRPLPSMPPPVLVPMDVADPPLKWPH